MATKKSARAHLALGGLIGFAVGGAVAAEPAPFTLTAADRQSVFKAAGAVKRNGVWVVCADDPNNTSGARIEGIHDLNSDGLPEVVVMEDGSFCHGAAGTGYHVLSKQRSGSWKVMTSGSGIPEFLRTRGANGWPDIAVGGPGFCFPVERWNGKEYALNRFEYQGKRCQPPR